MEQTTSSTTQLSQPELDTLDEQITAIPAAKRDLFLVSGAHAVIHAMTVLMPLIYPIIQVEYHLSYTQIGLIVAIPSVVGGFLQLFFGLLSRYILRKVMLGLGNILVGVSTFFTGTITGFWTLMLWRTCANIAGAPQHPVGSSYLTDRFGRKRHGYALAWHVAGGNIGTLAVPLIAGPLLGLVGWRPLLYIAALPGILFGIAILLWVDEKNLLDRRANQQVTEKPQTSEQSNRRNSVTPLGWKGNIKALIEPLRNRTLVIIILVSIIAAGGRGLGNITTYVPLYLQNIRHLNSTTISIYFTVLLLGSVVGPLVGGRLSDRLGRKRMLYFFYGASAVTIVLFVLLAGPQMPLWLIPVSLILMGSVIYAESPLLQALLADSAPPSMRDNAFGLYFALAFGIGSIWSAVLGWMIDQFGFGSAFLVMAVSFLFAGALLLFLRKDSSTNEKGLTA
jgi:FSR family fosmidomycin resistance protein-like MFS transporter